MQLKDQPGAGGQLNPQSEIRNPKLENPQSEIRNPQSRNSQSEIRNPKLENSQSEIRNPQLLHFFACFTAFSTFLLIFAGGLVTSNDAGLAVPDWPLSFGKWMPEMVGGVFYEHGHRMIAGFVGMLTIILAVWISLKEPRRWVRGLGWIALAVIVTQGLLGGITVLYFLPPAVSMAHAALAQGFFCLAVTLAVVTGSKWWSEASESETSDIPSLRGLSASLIGVIYLQLVFGAGYRHNALGVVPHIVGAAVVLFLTAWLAFRTVRNYPKSWARHVSLLLALVLGQTVLGVATFFIKHASQSAPQPTPEFVWSATSHVALGALILATALVFALRTQRHIVSRESEPQASTRSERSEPRLLPEIIREFEQ
ncbi:MAG TPA: COX15/CtaA family protein [Acidobacteriota bacterium]|nr:COX15/CtaA family protein [Acidobacteriota bacterium]